VVVDPTAWEKMEQRCHPLKGGAVIGQRLFFFLELNRNALLPAVRVWLKNGTGGHQEQACQPIAAHEWSNNRTRFATRNKGRESGSYESPG